MNGKEEDKREMDKPVLKHRAPHIRVPEAIRDEEPSAQSAPVSDAPSGARPGGDEPMADPAAVRASALDRAVSRRVEPTLTEEVLSSDPRFIGRVFSVEVQDVRLPDGRLSKREIVHHPGGASVVALDSEQHIYLVRQHRVGTGGPMREIPAGKLEPPEDALACARRELMEETGLSAERWDLLTRFYPSPGYTDEAISIYLARGLANGFSRPDEGEFLTVERIGLTDALDQIREGLLTDGKTCIGLFLAADRVGLL